MGLTTHQIITLLQLSGCGRVTTYKLALYAKENRKSFQSSEEFFAFIKYCKENKIALRIKNYNIDEIKNAALEAKQIINKSEENKIGIVTYFDDNYPIRLKELNQNSAFQAPIVLYYKGDINKANMPAVAIIGTREPTKEGKIAGDYFGKRFAEKGFNIISGLAVGCDTTGHKGALSTDKGVTTAFLAHGLDTVYPTENQSLAKEIYEKGGLLFSEYPIGTTLTPNKLVERDRLQAGLAQATVVIQTGIKGGTMHAVNVTLDLKKPLFVVEYKSSDLRTHEKVQGNSLLIKNGAIPLTTKSNFDEVIKIVLNSKNKNIQPSLDFFNQQSMGNSTKLQSKYKAIIFDMDMTLIDSAIAKSYRKNRDWQRVYSLIPEFKMYSGIDTVFDYIRNNNIKVCVVSTSPRLYLEKIIKHFQMPVDYVIGYHDANKLIKPNPAQMLLALKQLGFKANEVVSFGDRAIDIIASNSAGIDSIACFWGTEEPSLLNESGFIHSIKSAIEILEFI